MNKTIAILLLSIISPAAFAQSSTNPIVHLASQEQSLGKLAHGADPNSLTTDANFQHAAYVVKRGGKELVVVDGIEGKAYDKVAEKQEMYFSPDGKRLAYVAKRGDKKLVVVDGVEGKEYEGIYDLFNPVFSPDSKQVAYIADATDQLKQKLGLWSLKEFMVVNGVEGKAYELVEGIIFSPDSSKIAYAVQPKWNRSSRVIVNGVEGKEYNYAWRIIFSPDSQHLAYVAEKRDPSRGMVVIDGKEGPEYEGGNSPIGDIVFSPDSKHTAFLVRSRENKIVRDGVPMISPGTIQQYCIPVFSPDSQHLAYVSRGTNWMIVEDNKIFDDQQVRQYTHSLVFSPDSKHLAYVTRFDSPTNTGYDYPVIDGSVQKKFGEAWSDVYFSPDSQRVAYLTQSGEKTIPVYGEYGGNEYDRFVACAVDLNTKEMSGDLHRPFIFDKDGTLHAIAVRGDEVFRVELKIAAQ